MRPLNLFRKPRRYPAPLLSLIRTYYRQRGLKWPKDADTALMWAQTELGECMEILLARKGGWVRNNPGSKSPFDKGRLAEELGDVVMMVVVAGMVEGVDPLGALREKIELKLG